jgi:hypothetical protein
VLPEFGSVWFITDFHKPELDLGFSSTPVLNLELQFNEFELNFTIFSNSSQKFELLNLILGSVQQVAELWTEL